MRSGVRDRWPPLSREAQRAAAFEKWFGVEGYQHASHVSEIADDEACDSSRSTTRNMKIDAQVAVIDAMRAAFYAGLDRADGVR